MQTLNSERQPALSQPRAWARSRPRDFTLTRGEREVLSLVARGMTNQEIADRLGMSVSAVKTSIHQACNRTKARNRIEAVFQAIRHGVVELNDIFSLDELGELLASVRPETLELVAVSPRRKAGRGRHAARAYRVRRPESARGSALTNRERETLILVAHGLTNQEIADRLCTSVSTIRTFLYQACSKLGASNRAQAFICALKRKDIRVDEVFSLDELVESLGTLSPQALKVIASRLGQQLECAPSPGRSLR